jgi:5'-3' exonuclease
MEMDILIDGKNLTYKAIFASLDKITRKPKVDPLIIAFRMMCKWRRIYKPSNWYIFWDVPRERLWRKKLYPAYKDGRSKSFITKDELNIIVSSFSTIFISLCHNMKMTQLIRDQNEADDLMYAYVKEFQERETLIVSSDGDMTQALMKYNNVKLHDPKNKDTMYEEKPEYDPVIVKCLAGDTSDNIDGYRLVGDITAKKIIREGKLEAFLAEKGREMFDFNRQLVDLELNSHIQDNMKYVRSVKVNEKFDLKAINAIIDKYSLTELRSLSSDLIIPFKYNP